jgi:hypothetical protein
MVQGYEQMLSVACQRQSPQSKGLASVEHESIALRPEEPSFSGNPQAGPERHARNQCVIQ